MTRKGWLKGFAVLGLCSATALLGYGLARWQSGALDVLCAGDFEDYRTRIALTDARGVHIPADTLLRVRFCEYNAQARLEVLIDKSEFSQLQPHTSPRDTRWHYNLLPVEGMAPTEAGQN